MDAAKTKRRRTDHELTTDEVRTNIPQNIRRLRQGQLLRQCELARRAGIHPVNMSRVEGGKVMPNVETLLRIANALGTTIKNLCEPPKEKA
jgi:transcriptional regulator with XRE-family HTH domain